jgi:hypothetical protein
MKANAMNDESLIAGILFLTKEITLRMNKEIWRGQNNLEIHWNSP